MDNNETYREIELNYRKLYGRIFSGLISLFGSRYVELIEDAIQNAFYKSLKSWKPGKVPAKPLEWLFVVSKNEVLTQLRRNQKVVSLVQTEDLEENVSNYTTSDLRLEVLIIIAELEDLSTKTKILFILKNLFGLSIPEIHQSTLLGEEAIYKSIQRAKIKILPLDFKKEIYSFQIHENSRSVIHEILYSVFNAGFDVTLDHKEEIFNADISLEAMALTRALEKKDPNIQSKNLLALFTLHIARSASKSPLEIIPFYDQDRRLWNQPLIQLGLHYLTKPEKLDRYYLEALNVSIHMTSGQQDNKYWEKIAQHYQLLEQMTKSPIVKLNFAYVLFRLDQLQNAYDKLAEAKRKLPPDYFYLSLVEAEIRLKEEPATALKLLEKAANQTTQPLRKKFILDKLKKLNAESPSK